LMLIGPNMRAAGGCDWAFTAPLPPKIIAPAPMAATSAAPAAFRDSDMGTFLLLLSDMRPAWALMAGCAVLDSANRSSLATTPENGRVFRAVDGDFPPIRTRPQNNARVRGLE
jgi:hypothetical protein